MAKNTVTTSLLGRRVRLGRTMDQTNADALAAHERGEKWVRNEPMLIQKDYEKHAGKEGVIRSVYRDGECVMYTVEVDGDLIDVWSKSFRVLPEN